MDSDGKPKRDRTYLQLALNREERDAIEAMAAATGHNTHAFARDVLRVWVGLDRKTPGTLGARVRRD